MNSFAREILMRKMRDGRNPYGSRGGYIVNRSPRRDRAESEEDYARNNGTGYRDYANMNREYEDGRQGVKGTGRYGIGGSSYYGRDRANNEYDYNYGENYTRNNARDYGYGYGMFDYDIEDYAMWRDYASESMGKLTSKDIRKWERHLENADGTTGKKYEVDQIRQVAQQMGIHFDEYSPELLTAITNMMYSDYCKIHGNDLMAYVKMARAFLDDDDFDGTPEEKAYLYYKCIVEKE